ncbi:Dipeptide transport system permease protein DppB [Pseudidiomarina piscicola]|uniref:Dipeptide transport system permease protein DppB n=1 Tax=Pseudidiomarina piscicola TaxID=2614830 RepID=A0A6S6WLR4_9GAMM|nr:ABC transporter permease [Pseudidiomarina piscicola]CAB0149882.1 Dipeptide transport system permease protein DppB [Pseudidiomarina piscicola]VZT39328.1 Dipeptide transport system permease protein DppB [Pseudomonas aeruginosa]
MIRYTLRRLTLLIVTLWLLTVFLFSLNYFFPGDTLTNMTGIRASDSLSYQLAAEARGFDSSIFTQYLRFLGHFSSGDWGQSLTTQRDVFKQLLPLLGGTLELSVLAMLLAMVIGAPLGLYAARQQRGAMDRVVMGVSLSAYSVPVFWLAQLLILLFAVKLGWTPISGQLNPLFNIDVQTGSIILDILASDNPYKSAALADAINHLWLPVIVLAIMPGTMLMRITRNSMLEVLQQNYIRAARARGLSELRILFRHVLPNAMQPVVRQLGLMFSILMSNIIVTEVIFNWPGLGSWLVKSIYERDYPVLQGGLFAFATLILFVNVVVELFHAWRYPQVRKELYAEH